MKDISVEEDYFGEYPALEGTIVEAMRDEFEPHLTVPEPTLAAANWFYVMYETSGCVQNEAGLTT